MPVPRGPQRPAATVWLPWLVVAATIATIAVGLTAKFAFDAHWGAPAQPLILFLRPALSTWAIPGLALLGAALLAAPRLLRARIGSFGFGVALFAMTLVSRVALNVARGGPGDLSQVFSLSGGEGRTEYLPGLAYLQHAGVGGLLERWVGLIPGLPTHLAGHPPGLLLSMDALGLDSAAGLAALTIGVGALATPVLYLLARELSDEITARVAALLFVFVPTSLLYGATSADALYATLGVTAAALLLVAGPLRRALGAVALALASFFSYALLAAGAWAAIVRWRRDGFAAALRMALLCGAALAVFYLGLYLLTGFDLFAAIRATDARYREGLAAHRPYFFYLFGSPAAFLVMLGPVAWFAARALVERESAALGLAAVIAISVLAGYTKAETERIWLFLVPFACLAAARSLAVKRLPLVLTALGFQAIATEILFVTKW
ncbi:MAG: hypothetical protein H0X42_12660 [Solirubrobacterales bacterium]|nr:hypothetical protein [Solirubrobacterales bacterium]